ncbi:MAG: DUF2281 domain-containing protein [Pyrinomonadaceae bacterium]
MTDEGKLIAQIHSLPEALKAEVARFIDRISTMDPVDGNPAKRRRPRAGSDPGLFKMSPNFDDPIEGFEKYR